MKKSLKTIIYLIVLLVILAIALYLYTKKMYGYFLISLGFVLIFGLLLILNISKKTDDESVYETTIKTVLKKYDSILVETSTIPDFEGKNVMMITNIEDMIDASVEIRKPIYYKREDNYCTFILLDNQDISIYSLKVEKDVETPIEKLIKERKNNMEDLINQAKDSKNTGINNDNNEVDTTDNTPVESGTIPFDNNVIENSNDVEQPTEIESVTTIEDDNSVVQPIETPIENNEDIQSIEENITDNSTTETSDNNEPELIPKDNNIEEATSDTEEEIL